MSEQTEKQRPEYATDEMLQYLDELRESGDINMYGARSYLEREFPELVAGHPSFHSSEKAHAVLSYWMSSFPREPKP